MANFHQKVARSGQQPLFLPESRWTPPAELPSLRGIARLAVDIETHDPELRTMGPGFRRGARIVGLALGTDDWRQYFPVGHEGGGNLDERMVIAWAREELSNYRGEVVGTNLAYDVDGLTECWGVRFHDDVVFHDVQVAEPLLDEWREEFNLDALSLDYLGIGKDEALLNEAAAAFGVTGRDAIKASIHKYPANLVGPYAEGDVDRPLRIFPLQEKKLRDEGLWEIYDDVERRLIPILVAMRQRGVRIDRRRALQVRNALVIKRDEQLAQLKRLAGPAAEFMEVDSLTHALDERNIRYTKTKKTDKPQINKVLLERYAGDPLIDAITLGRRYNTMINTFIDSQILGHATGDRLHPTFKQLKDDDGGTIARFSGAHPNMQFIPARDEELAPLIRGLFLPEEGDEWQADDQSQVQFRLLSNFAVGGGAEESREQYRQDPDTDFHKMTADMLGADRNDKIKRKRVKNTNFAKVFGAQVPKLAATFGCSIEEAQDFMNEYERKLPFVKDTFDAAARWGQKRGFVVSVMGRKQRFPFWGPQRYMRHGPYAPLFRDREEAVTYWLRGEPKLYRGWQVRAVERVNTYMACNRKMQSSEGDIMKLWMVRAKQAGLLEPGALGALKVTVHDELGSSVPRTPAGDEAGRELVRIGETCIQLKVPLRVGSSRGKSWGDC